MGEYSPLKPIKLILVVSSPWLLGKNKVNERTDGNLAGLKRRTYDQLSQSAKD